MKSSQIFILFSSLENVNVVQQSDILFAFTNLQENHNNWEDTRNRFLLLLLFCFFCFFFLFHVTLLLLPPLFRHCRLLSSVSSFSHLGYKSPLWEASISFHSEFRCDANQFSHHFFVHNYNKGFQMLWILPRRTHLTQGEQKISQNLPQEVPIYIRVA